MSEETGQGLEAVAEAIVYLADQMKGISQELGVHNQNLAELARAVAELQK